jgi:hypothetical protein
MTAMRLDHVSYATTPHELPDVVNRLGNAVGSGFRDGGRHPRFGTRNFVLPLADGAYLEVVAALDHPAADRAPFGQAVRRRAESGGGWLGWVVAVDDIAPIEARLGRPAVAGHRVRPDGVDLTWRQIGVYDLMDDPQLPFFIAWEQAPEHPSAGGGDDVRIAGLEIAGDPAVLGRWLGQPAGELLGGVTLTWVHDDGPGLVAVHVDTPRGPVRLD